MTTQKMRTFMASDKMINSLDGVAKKLKISRSEAIRLAISELIRKYEKVNCDVVVVNRKIWDGVTSMLAEQLAKNIRKEVMTKMWDDTMKNVMDLPEIKDLWAKIESGEIEIRD
ncbi:MAG: ribbon-helix-helix protein, CopG family [Thermodesulfobacteriota bacterium]|nr:ribbon-helix-helix protein, CopG family [Thermodesulfobacteriota bacterium]